jgi:GntR family transcriptional regulator
MDLIGALIVERGLKAGDPLPTQHELAAMAGVSLITVRRALGELQRAGRVTSHQGVGSFVAQPRIVSEPGRSGGLHATLSALADSDHAVTTRLLELGTARPSPAVADALHITRATAVWQIRRLRLIDGVPQVLEQALVPAHLAPDLGARRTELTGSLYDLLARDHGLVDDHEEQYLSVGRPLAQERKLLGLAARSQVVRLRGVSSTPDGRPFDCFEQVYPADGFVFYSSGQTTRRLFRLPEPGGWAVTEGAAGTEGTVAAEGAAAAEEAAAEPMPPTQSTPPPPDDTLTQGRGDDPGEDR